MSETTELELHDENRIDTHDHEREPEPQETERPKTARDIAMEEISRRRIEAINRELRHGQDLDDDARRDAGLEPRTHNPEDLIEDPYEARQSRSERDAEPVEREPEVSQRGKSEPEPKEAKQPPLRTITIDGSTFSVTEEQYAALAGLGARTNVALQQHNAAQYQQQYQAPQPNHQQPAQSQRGQQQQHQALSDEEAENVAERLIWGGREQVAQTVKELSNRLVERTRAEQIDANEIVNRATRQAMEQQQLASDLTTISVEYPRIWEDRILGELAAVQLNHVRQELVATGRQASNLEMYREACNRVETALGSPKTSNGVNTNLNAQASSRGSSRASDRSEVLDRKRAAPSQPSAQGRRVSEVTAPRTRTGAEIVAAMRVARHQSPE